MGPGTGAVSEEIVRRLGPGDSLDLVELNAEFTAFLRGRIASEPLFQSASERIQVWEQSIEEFTAERPYDAIVSGLPLNNFSVDEVQRLLGAMLRLLRPGGSLSFFEYVAVRNAKALLAGPAERRRLRGIGAVIGQACTTYSDRRTLVWANVPPAWVHHLRQPSQAPVTCEPA